MTFAQVQDRAPLEKVRKLSDGRLTAVVRFARSGVYQYQGAEVGRPGLSTVNVYRPEDEVFSQDSMASFAHKAVTLSHPGQPVDAENWKAVAVGYTDGRVARDGGFVEIPLMVADAAAVAAYESGTATELSAGYSCNLVWQDGVAPDGTPYQAIQRGIRGNHIALVARGRAGSECRIGDAAFQESTTMTTEQIRNAVRDARYLPSAQPQSPTPAMGAGGSATAAEIRDLARRSRYNG